MTTLLQKHGTRLIGITPISSDKTMGRLGACTQAAVAGRVTVRACRERPLPPSADAAPPAAPGPPPGPVLVGVPPARAAVDPGLRREPSAAPPGPHDEEAPGP